MKTDIDLDEKMLCWLAGLFEGEASFYHGTPRGPRSPSISIAMIDKDVIDRVAHLFGHRSTVIPPQQEHWKISYLFRIRGFKAAELMRQLYPLLGNRRQNQINRALENYGNKPTHRGRFTSRPKLTVDQVRLIKRRIANGETAKSIAQDFDISHYAIWDIRSGKTWDYVTLEDASEDNASDSHPNEIFTPSPNVLLDNDLNRLRWLAGLLEGEGSFKAGPPSSPNIPAISMATTDEDIIARVAQIFKVKYFIDHSKKGHYKTCYVVNLRGSSAFEMMRLLYPWMSKRRQGQIDRALENYVYNPQCIITEDQARTVKHRLSEGVRMADIARELGISYAIIKRIKYGKTWKHVTL